MQGDIGIYRRMRGKCAIDTVVQVVVIFGTGIIGRRGLSATALTNSHGSFTVMTDWRALLHDMSERCPSTASKFYETRLELLPTTELDIVEQDAPLHPPFQLIQRIPLLPDTEGNL